MKRIQRHNHKEDPPCFDMRGGMDFFCMLKACAIIRNLEPGTSVLMQTNDPLFLADLRRMHEKCVFERIPTALGFEEDTEYVIKISKL